MILPLSAIWGGEPFNPLAGNAQVFDGTFDYDIVSNFVALNTTDSYSIMFDFNNTTISRSLAFASDINQSIANSGLELLMESGGKIRFLIVNGSGKNYFARTQGTINTGYNNIIYSYNGSVVTIYINGVLAPIDTLANSLSGTTTGTRSLYLGALPPITTGAGRNLFNGKIKTTEIINRAITAEEAVNASAGSFRSAGIAHNSGQYLLAVDFNKVDGQNPATFADTPAYTITGFGGTTYAPYL